MSDAMERQSKMAALLEAVRSGDLGKKKQVENNQETVLITSKLARKDVVCTLFVRESFERIVYCLSIQPTYVYILKFQVQ